MLRSFPFVDDGNDDDGSNDDDDNNDDGNDDEAHDGVKKEEDNDALTWRSSDDPTAVAIFLLRVF